ncbi:MAG: DUF5667 domain-containing protein [bacterium]|nr:DUF5667 domain-containing protein [bacterium]
MKKTIFSLIIVLPFLIVGSSALAQSNDLPDPGLTPDSNFYFLKIWKESIQTFFTFGEENKARQLLRLSEVRLAEYKKMIEKGKTEIAQKALDKYEKQFNRALEKADQTQEKGKNVEKLKEAISEKILKHQEVLKNILEKAPEQAKQGIEKAIEASQKGFEEKLAEVEGGLQIVLKDYVGFPEVKYLQPTIKEIQLQNEGGNWVTIWNSPEGKTVKLTADGAEMVLDTVSVEAGTYVATRLLVSTIDVEVDIDRDGDTSDKNMEIILTEAEFNSLPPKERPQPPSKPQAPEKPQKPSQPSAPSAPSKPSAPSGPPSGPPSEPSQPSGPQSLESTREGQRTARILAVGGGGGGGGGRREGNQPSAPSKPSEPSQPSAPSEPTPPYRIVDGIVYTGEYRDEKHTVTLNDHIIPLFGSKFVYGGTGGKIIYDFTLNPLVQKAQQISVTVSRQ